MAKKEEKATKIEKPKEEKHSFFPRLLLLFSILLVALAIVDYLTFLAIPKLVIDLVLAFTGLWMLKISFEKGFGKKRKELLKKYI